MRKAREGSSVCGIKGTHWGCFLGAVLLDLNQHTLPGIAHQVVEQMIISDQIKVEDRANVLRALLLKHRYVFFSCCMQSFIYPATLRYSQCLYTSLVLLHKLSSGVLSLLFSACSHPSDEKEHSSFTHNISAASLASLMVNHHSSSNHIGQAEPSVTDTVMGGGEAACILPDTRIDMEKSEVFT